VACTDENMSTPARPVTKKLTTDEILGNVSIFLAGATEMTSTLLSYCTYVMATNPEVQQKLKDEIDANIGSDVQSPTHEMIDKLVYLDMFIKEVSRMYPISPIVLTRLCIQDTTIGQYTLKKGNRISHVSEKIIVFYKNFYRYNCAS
jgi:cytochrome P450